jgi:co-chaperonin GroES (HSP10)
MNLKPLNNNVLVDIDQPPKTTASGLLHLPETIRNESHRTGIVRAVGPKVKELVEGDRVLLPWYGGLKMEQPMQLLVREEEVFARQTIMVEEIGDLVIG